VDRDRQIALGTAFLKAHKSEDIIVLPNAWDVASALLLVRAGFKAIATTSAGIGYTGGYPVGEVMPLDEMLADIRRMTDRIGEQSNAALSADMESGYGITPDEVAATVTKTIAAGAVGINIEDTDHRTRGSTGGGTGSSTGGALFDFALAVERIAGAREAADATGIPFVLNARTDTYWHGARDKTVMHDEAHDETLRRAAAFRDAGADCIFVPGPTDREVIARLATDIDAPLNVMGGAKSPGIDVLSEIGVRRVTVGAIMARATYDTLEKAAAELRDTGTFTFADGIMSHADLNGLMARK
jgi:2-methylisocitrate lyase-like PEP mutase family enzyme